MKKKPAAVTAAPALRVVPWVLVLAAAGILYALHAGWIQRCLYVSNLAEWSVDSPEAEASSATGYADEWRRTIALGDFKPSYPWIMDTQAMLAARDWRVRQTGWDNAPHGRAVHEASAYRWVMVAGAAVDRMVSSRSWPHAIERAALWINPLLHLLVVVLIGTTAARCAGGLAGAGAAVLAAILFPLAASFAGGAPNPQPLFIVAVAASLLALLIGTWNSPAGSGAGESVSASRRWFAASGVAGAIALWIHAADFLPLLLAIGGGALLAAWLDRRARSGATTLPAEAWRWWGWAGGIVSLLAYGVEYAPDVWVWRLDVNHPWFAFGWIAWGEALARGTSALQTGFANRRDVAILVACGAVVVSVLVGTILDGGAVVVTGSAEDVRLSPVVGIAASSVSAWLREAGGTLLAGATLVPVLVVVAGGLLLRRKEAPARERAALALLLMPAAVVIAIAMMRLRVWAVADAVILCLFIPIIGLLRTNRRKPSSAGWWAIAGAIVFFSGAQTVSLLRAAREQALTASEATALVERDVAHWLDRRAGTAGAVALAPPELTIALAHFGGVRGLGTMAWENREGLNAAIRIAAASSPEEAHALLTARGVTHIVMPSWEPFLEQYARLGQGAGTGAANNSLIGALRQWAPPDWLRPIPYPMPKIDGFSGENLVVFERVEEPAPAVARSRLVEYFLEMGNNERAIAAATSLHAFPSDPAAVAALARVAAAHHDEAGFTRAIADLESLLGGDAMYFLPWDRRVSVALTLARASRFEAAGDVLQQCLADVDETALRSLTTGSLQLLLHLCRRLEQPLPEPALQELALQLLPPAARERLR